MGAPKQKWTAEEEAALKAGVVKHGPGKWSTILKDSEFGTILHSRSNVDLKDKWRNMNVMASGSGSRQRARPASKISQQTPKSDDISIAPSTAVERDLEIVAKPLEVSNGASLNGGSKKPISRLDDLILEAIINLKEPRGSSRAAIATYIEERYFIPSDLEKLLQADLKILRDDAKLIKVKHQYRIAPSSSSIIDRKGKFSPSIILEKDPSSMPVAEKRKCSPRTEINTIKALTKAQIDAELEKMRSMTAQEAAAAAVQAVAEAEAAIAEAEEAARQAEAAEAEAEAAQVFAAAAMKALKCTTLCA